MGPGAGTAMLGGTCLGFANVVRPGRVGVVAAAGTGAQEVASLVDRWGVGVSQVIGLGGRDLGAAVGGLMAGSAVRALVADAGTEVILLVSKPPDPGWPARCSPRPAGKPLVAALIGLPAGADASPGACAGAGTLEAGAAAAVRAARRQRAGPDRRPGGARSSAAMAGLAPRRTLVRGLFSGGTLCYESLVRAGRACSGRCTRTPRSTRRTGCPPRPARTSLPRPRRGGVHPGPAAPDDRPGGPDRAAARARGASPTSRPCCSTWCSGTARTPTRPRSWPRSAREITAAGGPRVVVYVLGTEHDPQGYARQRRAFADAGCLVTETAARASLAAAAIATRDPRLPPLMRLAMTAVTGTGNRGWRWSRTRPSRGAGWCTR